MQVADQVEAALRGPLTHLLDMRYKSTAAGGAGMPVHGSTFMCGWTFNEVLRLADRWTWWQKGTPTAWASEGTCPRCIDALTIAAWVTAQPK